MQEKERIEKMLAEGKITKEEADNLLSALKEGEKVCEVSTPGTMAGKQRTSRLAIASLITSLAGILLFLIGAWVSSSDKIGELIALIGVGFLPIAIALGIIAFGYH